MGKSKLMLQGIERTGVAIFKLYYLKQTPSW